MQYLQLSEHTTLSELSQLVGSNNVASVLASNGLTWGTDIGGQLKERYTSLLLSRNSVPTQKKISILNGMDQDAEIFERAAQGTEEEWAMLAAWNQFPYTLHISDDIILSSNANVIGNSGPVSKAVYDSAIAQLRRGNEVDPQTFSTYSSKPNTSISDITVSTSSDASKVWGSWFHIPWGKVTLHSSLDDTSIDFPCYPTDPSDSRKANYDTMQELLYQTEPWQLYHSSGPRSNTYSFEIHRDMWTGNHLDGKANELLRFCEACCYPNFNGSLVNTTIATLYIHGKPLIRGVITEVSVEWDGPIGQDGWRLNMKLSISFTEVSKNALNYNVVKSMPLIGQ